MRIGRIAATALAAVVVGCSGGGGGGSHEGAGSNPGGGGTTSPPPAPPPSAKSPGGIWHGPTTDNDVLTLFVAENGEFRSISNQAPGSGTPPAFGTGTIESETAGRISGAYVQKRIETVPTSDTESCTLDGTLTERVSMSVTVTCTDSANQQKRFSTILGSDANYSADGSSLSAIAGNYTLPPAPESNVLNINGDGTVFGLYKNGAIDCTVNGLVSIIDAAYNLYRVEWTLSNCASTLQSYEGVTMTGFTYRILVGPQQGSILVLLSGAVGDRLDFASLLYEPT